MYSLHQFTQIKLGRYQALQQASLQEVLGLVDGITIQYSIYILDFKTCYS